MKKENKIKNRKKIIQFIKTNPKTTYREIREKIKIHPERYFKSLKEAFIEAGIEPPRTYEIKTKEENKKLIIDYIKKHPCVRCHIIAKELKRTPSNFFRSIRDAYKEAGVKYKAPSRKIDKKTKEKKKKEIIKLVKENPLITCMEIYKKIGVFPYNLFKNMREIYKTAGIKEIKNHEKRTLKIKERIIEFIKNNPLATQREINKACNTHVQELFAGGIFEVYKKAGVEFPYERLKLHGAALKEIRQRSKSFEDELAVKLSGYGKVNRLMKTKRGFADIVFERKDKKIIIELKDYKAKDISISQIKQLNKYLEDCNTNIGILICHKKPKKDKFLIGKNTIFLLEKQDLHMIPEIVG